MTGHLQVQAPIGSTEARVAPPQEGAQVTGQVQVQAPPRTQRAGSQHLASCPRHLAASRGREEAREETMFVQGHTHEARGTSQQQTPRESELRGGAGPGCGAWQQEVRP